LGTYMASRVVLTYILILMLVMVNVKVSTFDSLDTYYLTMLQNEPA
jgi:hypothetical protein